MYEIKVNASWAQLGNKEVAKLLGISKKQIRKCFPGLADNLAEAKRVARPYLCKGRKGTLAWDRFEEEHFIFFVNPKTGKRKILLSTTDPAEAKVRWKKLVRKQK